MSEKILQNQVRCNKCGDEPYSAYRHDFKFCKCGTVAVDGGMSYLRRAGDLSDVTDLSIRVPQKVYDDCVDALKWAKDTGRNELGTICALFRVLRDNGYDLRSQMEENDDPTR